MSADTDLEFAVSDLGRSVTWTIVSGAAATQYPLDNAFNQDPSYPFKAGTTVRIQADFTVPVRPEYAALIHFNGEPDLVTLFEGNSAASWGAPPFSEAFPPCAYTDDDCPINLGLDLRDVLTTSYRYFSWVVPVANNVILSLGEFFLTSAVQALNGHLLIEGGPSDDEQFPIVEHRTDVGVSTIYEHGTRLRWLRGSKIEQPEDEARIKAWFRSTHGRGVPFLLLPNLPTEIDEPWYVRWEKDRLPRTFLDMNLDSRWQLEFEELSRGLYKPTPSAV